eukprot:11183945-Alexandrium_andersonii.AAC.1
MWGSAAPRWQRFGAVSCAPPPRSHRGGLRPPEPPKKRLRCALEGAGAPPVRAGWGRAGNCSKTLPA